ncbi:ribosome biogenesis protein [Candidatus Woesearchaeota archaeon]|nr:ribosome biogenesis protein [Candidatus Woesearchaeota archaeon]
MPKIILKCNDCGNYTIKDKCTCGGKAIDPRPAKYSIEDKYGHYRRLAKKK